jgi:GNAT superfamily N-acetyltransferase
MLIRKANQEDLDQLLLLMNCTAKQKIDKHIYRWQHNCEISQLKEQIENEEVFVLMDKERIIGSYSIKPLESYYPVKIDESYHMYRMVVHPFYKEKDLTSYMFKHVRKKYHKKHPVLFDCWSGNERLIEYYDHQNCIRLGDYPASDYKITVFQVGRDKHGK